MSKIKQVLVFMVIFSLYAAVCTDEYNQQVKIEKVVSDD